MNITPIKTDKIIHKDDLLKCVDSFVPTIEEQSVLVITSKIISILEGNTIPTSQIDKQTLIAREADQYIPAASSQYHVTLSITRHTLIANSGIDESNGNDQYILWPKDPFQSATAVWNHIKQRDQITRFGVVVSDSRITPLRWGTIGVGLAWCGIEPLRNYIGKPDIFGRHLLYTKSSILDGIAASAVLVMGEGNEQTPMALVTQLPQVEFTTRAPTKKDRTSLEIELESDLFAPLLTNAPWQQKK